MPPIDVIRDKHQFILNYSSLDMDGLEDALLEIKECAFAQEQRENMDRSGRS
jgi:hypothetical protein